MGKYLYKTGNPSCMKSDDRGQADDVSELLNYYDAEGKLLGTLPRKEIHARRLINRHEAFYVTNSQNELLIQLRSAKKELNPGLWDKPGGHVPGGKHYSLSEIAEEACYGLGVKVILLPRGDFRRAVEAIDLSRTIVLTSLEETLNYAARRIMLDGSEEIERIHLNSFVGRYDGPTARQPAEVQRLKWVNRQKLEAAIRADPKAYTYDLRDMLARKAEEIFKRV